MKQLLLSTLALFLLSCLHAQPRPAAPPSVLFILDASGSMWQKTDGAYKIATAKSVLQELAGQLPAGSRVGLVAYGHRQKSDCGDIETLLPLAPLNPAEFSAKLTALDPKGMTPIARSLRHALDALKNETAPVTCILISDGLETCEGNACDIVRQARAQGVRITLHVVGFALAENDLSSLECIAQAGGGQYLPAADAKELSIALKITVAPPPAGDAFLSVAATLDGKPLDVSVKIFKKGDLQVTAYGRTYTGRETNPRVFQLAPGNYDLQATAITLDGKPMQTVRDLVVKAGDTTRQTVDFAQTRLSVKVTRNGNLSDATVTLYQAGVRQVAATTRSYRDAAHNPIQFQVLPGNYDLEIKSVEIEDRPAVVLLKNRTLPAGEQLALEHDFASAELKIGARKGAELVDATVVIYHKKDNRQVAAGRTYSTASNNPKSFTLEPGIYRVELKPVKPNNLPKKTFEIEVKAKETAERIVEW